MFQMVVLLEKRETPTMDGLKTKDTERDEENKEGKQNVNAF